MHGFNHQPISSAEFKQRVELLPLWAVSACSTASFTFWRGGCNISTTLQPQRFPFDNITTPCIMNTTCIRTFTLTLYKELLSLQREGSTDARGIQHIARGHDRMDRWRAQITGGRDTDWTRAIPNEKNKTFIRLFSLRETVVAKDTRVVTSPSFNQQIINVTRQLNCHRREYLIDYNRHQDRQGIKTSSVEGVIFRSAPEHKIRDCEYEVISAQDDKGHCPAKVLDGFLRKLLWAVSNESRCNEIHDILAFYAA